MSERTETAAARYIVVTATAEPGTMDLGDGEANSVSAIRFADRGNQISFVIEGRPEDVLSKIREALALAEENLMQTVRSPELRALYGMAPLASQPGTDPTPNVEPKNRAWHREDGARCGRANLTHDCPGNHAYGPTFAESI